jgi:dephospho-CoA kinase
MLKVGITGGIGSGKSVVSKCFQLLGIPVYNADDAARKLMNENSQLRLLLIEHFGKDAFNSDNSLNRSWLASKVFNDEIKLQELNALVHPAVANDYKNWIELSTNAPYTIREAAILFETGLWKELDFIILVDAPEELRIKRVQLRDHRTVEAIKAIINRQWTTEKKRTLAHAIIENDDQHLVLPQVMLLHSKFLNYGS